jgi:hypothetical protein
MHTQDIEYLKSAGISAILSRGLAETYLNKPAYPVDFLAKWLLRHVEIQRQKEAQKAQQEEIRDKCEAVLLEEHQRLIAAEESQLRTHLRNKERLKLVSELENVG